MYLWPLRVLIRRVVPGPLRSSALEHYITATLMGEEKLVFRVTQASIDKAARIEVSQSKLCVLRLLLFLLWSLGLSRAKAVRCVDSPSQS